MRLLRDFKCFGTDILPLRMAARLIFLPEESILPELEVAVFAAVQAVGMIFHQCINLGSGILYHCLGDLLQPVFTRSAPRADTRILVREFTIWEPTGNVPEYNILHFRF